ncbi:MAG: RDD family protein [Opitutales bacterium]
MKSVHGDSTQPAPFFLRMAAFALDCVFILFAASTILPIFHSAEIAAASKTFANHVERFKELSSNDRHQTNESGVRESAQPSLLDANQSHDGRIETKGNANSDATTKSFEDARKALEQSFENDPSIISIITLFSLNLFWVGFAYWLIGERLFGGSSLGKRMFSLATVDLRDGLPPRTGICLLRAALKAFPALTFIFVFSYLIAPFNRRFLAGHDFACRTIVIRGQFSSKDREESTNAMD